MSTSRRSSKSLQPAFLALEGRALQTVVSPLAFGGAGLKAEKAQAAAATVTGSTPGSPAVDAAPSAFLDPNTLTPRGLAGSKFIASISGPYAVTSPLYVGQSRDITYIGTIHSNQFLHGTLVMKVEVNGAGTEVAGFAAFRDRNVAATGSIAVVDLGASATNSGGTGVSIPTTFDSLGRPTSIGFNIDTNGSGGSYAGALGEGVLKISYKTGGALNAAGVASITISGFIMRSNVSDITLYDIPKFS